MEMPNKANEKRFKKYIEKRDKQKELRSEVAKLKRLVKYYESLNTPERINEIAERLVKRRVDSYEKYKLMRKHRMSVYSRAKCKRGIPITVCLNVGTYNKYSIAAYNLGFESFEKMVVSALAAYVRLVKIRY